MVKTDLFGRQHLAIFLIVFSYVHQNLALKLSDRDTTLIRQLCSHVLVSVDPPDSVPSLVSSSLLLKVPVNHPWERRVASKDVPPRIVPSRHSRDSCVSPLVPSFASCCFVLCRHRSHRLRRTHRLTRSLPRWMGGASVQL